MHQNSIKIALALSDVLTCFDYLELFDLKFRNISSPSSLFKFVGFQQWACNHQQFVSDCGQCTTHGSSVRRSPLGLISPVKTLRVGRKLRLKMQKVDKARKEREARCESMNFYDVCMVSKMWIWHDLD